MDEPIDPEGEAGQVKQDEYLNDLRNGDGNYVLGSTVYDREGDVIEELPKKKFATKQEELDYWAEIETAARAGNPPEHDCGNVGGEPQGCQTCEDYQTS